MFSPLSPRFAAGRNLLFLFCFSLGASVLLSGCSLGYLAKQGIGQFRLMSHRVPLEKALQDGSLSSQQADKVRLIEQAKRFAEEKLGLKKTKDYQEIVFVPGENISYSVSAAPKDRLVPYYWWFPIVGRVPYKGFFSLQDAEKEQKSLEAKGYDTILQGVTAYSTLGWFEDPIFSTLLSYDDLTIINTIIHELVHATFFAKGEVGFNESTAVFIAAEGTAAFARWKFGESSAQALEAEARLQDEFTFSRFLVKARDELERLYKSKLSRQEKLDRRAAIFARIRADFQHLLPSLHSRLFRGAFSGPINNAVMVSYLEYHLHMKRYRKLLKEEGESLKRLVVLFRRAAKAKDPFSSLNPAPEQK